MEYAAYEFGGVRPHSHGGTEKQHIEALRKMGAPIPEEPSPEIPHDTYYLMDCFKSLRFARVPKGDTSVLMPREMLNWSTIESYSKSSGLDLAPWEIETIMSIDGIFESERGA